MRHSVNSFPWSRYFVSILLLFGIFNSLSHILKWKVSSGPLELNDACVRVYMTACFHFNIASVQNNLKNKYVLCCWLLVHKGGMVWPVCLSVSCQYWEYASCELQSHIIYTLLKSCCTSLTKTIWGFYLHWTTGTGDQLIFWCLMRVVFPLRHEWCVS